MELKPKPYIVYWTSLYAGSGHTGYRTPKYKANSKSFESMKEAHEFKEKILALMMNDGTYLGRKVYHVAAYPQGFIKEDLLR